MRSCRRPAFTLIEMLVVIAIVGVLAAILLPAVSRSKEYAKKTYCQNNLRQFGLAVRSYLMLYNGYWPASGTETCSRSTKDRFAAPYYPVDLLTHQMGRPSDAVSLLGFAAGIIDPQEIPKVCYCPSTNLDAATSLYDNRDPLRQYWWNAHVDGCGALTERWKSRANLWDTMGPSPWPEGFPSWVRIVYAGESVVSHPSELAIMGDTPDHSGRYIEAGSPWMNFAGPTRYGTSGVSRRHLNGSNLLYADGHVDWRSWGYLELEENLRFWLLRCDGRDSVFFPEIP